MKNKIYRNSLIFSLVFTLLGCTRESKLSESQIKPPQVRQTELDLYINKNIVEPYNIEIKYLWDEKEIDYSKTLYPPTPDKVKPVIDALLKVWIDPYNQAGGNNFIKKIAPRKIVLLGGNNYNSSGTITLGVAEAGAKISLFRTDLIDFTQLSQVDGYFHTIQHEYVHILNQTRPYDPNYGKITPTGYTGQWFNSNDKDSRELGFITAYARSNANEDFAEMASAMLINSKASYDKIINSITSSNAKAGLREKERIIVNYYKESFNIDLYELQRIVRIASYEFVETQKIK